MVDLSFFYMAGNTEDTPLFTRSYYHEGRTAEVGSLLTAQDRKTSLRRQYILKTSKKVGLE